MQFMLDKAWVLIGKKLTNEASPEELKRLDEILEQNPVIKYQFAVLEKLWTENKLQQNDDEIRWDKFEDKLLKAEEKSFPGSSTENRGKNSISPKKYRHFILGALCALVILTLAITFFYPAGLTKDDEKVSEIAAPMGAITKIHLSDGTRVWLNSGSKLSYKKSFGSKCRDVSLTGEAFFDVTKDASHPFIVHTSTLRIKVLGTRFNVRAYLNDKISEATLLSGQINLTVLKNPEKEIVMKPLEKVFVKNEDSHVKNRDEAVNTPLIVLSKIQAAGAQKTPAEIQWTDNILAFDEENLEDLANKMERRFNVSIDIEPAALRKTKFTGRFKNENLEEAFSELQAARNFHYTVENNHVTIY